LSEFPVKSKNTAATGSGPDKMSAVWRRRGILRGISILAVSAVIAAVISSWGMIRDFGSFHASLLTGSRGGAYYSLGSQLAERTKVDGSRLDIIATAGSLENVSRLIADRNRCVEQFAFDRGQCAADGGNRPRSALPVVHEPGIGSPDGFERPREFPFNLVPFKHSPCCRLRPAQRSTDTCVVYSRQSRPYRHLTQP